MMEYWCKNQFLPYKLIAGVGQRVKRYPNLGANPCDVDTNDNKRRAIQGPFSNDAKWYTLCDIRLSLLASVFKEMFRKCSMHAITTA